MTQTDIEPSLDLSLRHEVEAHMEPQCEMEDLRCPCGQTFHPHAEKADGYLVAECGCWMAVCNRHAIQMLAHFGSAPHFRRLYPGIRPLLTCTTCGAKGVDPASLKFRSK